MRSNRVLVGVVLVGLCFSLGCGSDDDEADAGSSANMVYVQDGDRYFHSKACSELKGGDAYDKAEVIRTGYKPCSTCQKTGVRGVAASRAPALQPGANQAGAQRPGIQQQRQLTEEQAQAFRQLRQQQDQQRQEEEEEDANL